MENAHTEALEKIKSAKESWQEVVTLCNLDGDLEAAHAASKILCKLMALEFQLNALLKFGL